LLNVLPAGLPLSIELRSKALRDGWPDPVARARRLLQATLAYFDKFDRENSDVPSR
jgi:hypothetical protein